jgi:hypothetical protein
MNNGTVQCVDPQPNTTTWVMVGVFIGLSMFSWLICRFLFRGISGLLRRNKYINFKF